MIEDKLQFAATTFGMMYDVYQTLGRDLGSMTMTMLMIHRESPTSVSVPISLYASWLSCNIMQYQ
jgi:hypothetical protein